MFDPEKFGEAMGAAIREACAPLLKRIEELETKLNERPVVSNVIDMPALDEATQKAVAQHFGKLVVKDGLPGKDGLGLAGAMIDRDGALQITLTNGEVKSLGLVVGKDGRNGVDGVSFDSFDLEYLAETHEMAVKATAAGRTKELRYPAGGIRPAGYWREGTKALPGEAWVHDGSLWIATKGTPSKPATGEDWIIAARKGRDGERGNKGADGTPVSPIKLTA